MRGGQGELAVDVEGRAGVLPVSLEGEGQAGIPSCGGWGHEGSYEV